jgi:coenzyme PQQ precursor peptide PqqA
VWKSRKECGFGLNECAKRCSFSRDSGIWLAPGSRVTSCLDFGSPVGYALRNVRASDAERYLGEIMEWKAPAFEEVCLNCEINSYASAKL